MEEGGCNDLSSPPKTSKEPASEAADGSDAEEEHPVVLPMVEVVRYVGDPFLFGDFIPGISSFTLSPSINLFTNQLNVSGLDWVEGLNNLTLSSQPLDFSSPKSTAILREPPQDSTLESNEVEVLSPCSPPKSTDSGYFICSCTKGTSGGLGKATLEPPKGRGMISYIAKA